MGEPVRVGRSAGREQLGQVRAVVLSVRDMDRACRFYEDVLGLTLAFRDGSRWAQFDVGPVAIALAGDDQRPGDDPVAVNIKVPDVGAATDRLSAAATAVEGPSAGAHEITASFRDPDGHLFRVYAPIPRR